jgi:arylsulfatase A-like enzyme
MTNHSNPFRGRGGARVAWPLRLATNFTFGTFLWSLSLFASASQSRAQTKPLDIYLITIDTLRADHVHCYGDASAQTPALDALAQDGILFTQAFTPSPITQTSHTTILTGLLPVHHGVTDFGSPLAAQHPTLATVLKPVGYKTAAFIGSVVLDSKTMARGLDHGFDFYDNFPAQTSQKPRWGRVERRAADVVQHAESWLDAHRAGPHFMWVHLYDPHDPYEPPSPYAERFKDRPYDGEIAYADSAVANFIAYLKKQGWYDQAIVIVVGDHGEGLGEHNEDTHGIFLYDSTTHVPLILKRPSANGVGSGSDVSAKNRSQRIDVQVRTTDIVPTILDLLALPMPEQQDGESLLPLLAGNETASRMAFGETNYPLSFGWAPLRSIRDAATGTKFIEAPRPEFYDLRTDPGEKNNTYQPWDASVQKLRAMLREAFPAQDATTKPPGAVSAQTTDELKALGYLGPADVGSSSTVSEPSLLPDPKDKIREQNLLHRAMLAEESDRVGDARAALEKLLQLDPESASALSQLGALELSAGDTKTAAEHLAHAHRSRPTDATTATHLGEALSAAGDLAGAKEALQSSLKIDSKQYRTRLLLGEVLLRSNDMAGAKDQLEAAQLIDTASGAALERVIQSLARQQSEEALRQLQLLRTARKAN